MEIDKQRLLQGFDVEFGQKILDYNPLPFSEVAQLKNITGTCGWTKMNLEWQVMLDPQLDQY